MSLFRRTAAETLRGEDGNVLAVVMIVAMLVGVLSSLALAAGRQADVSSSSDRNHDLALGVAEGGLHVVLSRISAQAAGTDASTPNFWTLAVGATTPSSCGAGNGVPAAKCDAARSDTTGGYASSTPQGKYWFWVTRTGQGFVVDTQATVGGSALGRGRHVQTTLLPPTRFGNNTNYVIFSYTSVVLGNNDQVLDGDVWANNSITVANSNKEPTVKGSLTAATSWVQLNSAHVTGNVWSGGWYCASPPSCSSGNWAIDVGGSSRIDGWAKASVTAPSDPQTCSGETTSNYNVVMDNGSNIGGDLTTLGQKAGAGTVSGSIHSTVCTAAPAAQAMPLFTFNRNNYDPSTYHELSSVSAFQSWLANNNYALQGTFMVTDSAPSQSNRIDLTGAKLTGPTTIVTNAPVYTGNLDDSGIGSSAIFVVVSHYRPPTQTGCSTVSDTSECAVHVKNNFSLNTDGTCKTATLLYGDLGPVAIKNGQTMCGSIVADGILVKNDETVNNDSRVARVVGFGPSDYVVNQWKELAAQ